LPDLNRASQSNRAVGAGRLITIIVDRRTLQRDEESVDQLFAELSDEIAEVTSFV
jgi:hypothetical protein